MGLFRKRETYNEQMLREAGLDRVVFNTPSPPATPSVPMGNLPHFRPPPRVWDTVTTVSAAGIAGDEVAFVVLPEGDLVVEAEEGDANLSPLADAVEAHLSPPYRAIGTRQDGDLWAVGARQIDIATFVFPDAEALELTQNDGVTELRVDGEPSDSPPPVELSRLGERAGADFCVEANRIDGDSWEVEVSPL